MVLENLFYTETHEWVKVDGNIATIGITDYAQHELGDIVFVELPDVDDEVTKGEPFGTIEAVKAVEDLNCPVSGKVVEINENLDGAPETINESAFEEGWIVKIELSDKSELENLLNAEAYKKIIEE